MTASKKTSWVTPASFPTEAGRFARRFQASQTNIKCPTFRWPTRRMPHLILGSGARQSALVSELSCSWTGDIIFTISTTCMISTTYVATALAIMCTEVFTVSPTAAMPCIAAEPTLARPDAPLRQPRPASQRAGYRGLRWVAGGLCRPVRAVPSLAQGAIFDRLQSAIRVVEKMEISSALIAIRELQVEKLNYPPISSEYVKGRQSGDERQPRSIQEKRPLKE